jgi:hypothetical protein
MGNWAHPICDDCWKREFGARLPVRIVESVRDTETCCWCGKLTFSGIYYRENPSVLQHHKPHGGEL